MVVYYGSHQFRRLCKPTCTPKSESCNVRALCELVVVVDVSQIFSYLWLKMDRLIRDFKELVALREDNHNHMEDMFIRKLNIESQLLKRIEEQIEVLQERRSEFCPSCLRRSRVKYRNQSAQTPRPKPSTTVIIPGQPKRVNNEASVNENQNHHNNEQSQAFYDDSIEERIKRLNDQMDQVSMKTSGMLKRSYQLQYDSNRLHDEVDRYFYNDDYNAK